MWEQGWGLLAHTCPRHSAGPWPAWLCPGRRRSRPSPCTLTAAFPRPLCQEHLLGVLPAVCLEMSSLCWGRGPKCPSPVGPVGKHKCQTNQPKLSRETADRMQSYCFPPPPTPTGQLTRNSSGGLQREGPCMAQCPPFWPAPQSCRDGQHARRVHFLAPERKQGTEEF